MNQSRERTEDLLLEELNSHHAEHLYDILQDDKIYTYIPENAPVSIKALKDRYKILEKGSLKEEEIWLNYAIYSFVKKEYIGTLQATVLLDKSSIMMAYVLDPRVWGEGYASKALSMMIADLNSKFKDFSYYAYIDTRNKRSIKLVKNLGFKCIDYIENADFFKGSSSNEFVFKKVLY
ncbi:GNAT family N-acetyltransferase [Shouchella shacheensis]|uniref:GNAT family N-acetyltransferase n=1 Tax=Shouchella shacheensis TaxID=1649580 RepID=UPI0007400653|nr:GNAT family protein [Shouchella shacheensis]